MQIDRREQRQLGLRNARIELWLCPVEIGLDLLLECLECRQILLVDARLGEGLDVARDELVILEVVGIKRILLPVQDGLQDGDVAGRLLDLVIRDTFVLAGFGIRIVLVPDQVLLHGLELAAGGDGVAADFTVLLDHGDGVPVLRCLHGSGHAGAACADDHDIVSLVDVRLGLMHHLVGLEGIEVAHARLLCRIRQRIPEAHRRKCGTGDRVDAGPVGCNRILHQVGEGGRADMGRLHVVGVVDVRDAVLREGDGQVDRPIVSVCRPGVGSRGKGERYCLRRLRGSSVCCRSQGADIHPGRLEGCLCRLDDGVARDRCAGYGVN